MEITKTMNGFVGTIIVAEHDKRRIHIIGNFGEETGELQPYEAFIIMGEEWTDGFEFECSHDMPDVMSTENWDEEIEFLIPTILWDNKQDYETIITDEHRELVENL